MSDADLLYRRALCKGKPLLLPDEHRLRGRSRTTLVEKYMKRSLAYGMFPGFFSHNASEGHYFTRPELYDRDRPLFKKYVPLCKLVAEAGWEPITAGPIERRTCLRRTFRRQGRSILTVFNDSVERRIATIRLEGEAPSTSRELVEGKTMSWTDRKTEIELEGEGVAVLEIQQGVAPK